MTLVVFERCVDADGHLLTGRVPSLGPLPWGGTN